MSARVVTSGRTAMSLAAVALAAMALAGCAPARGPNQPTVSLQMHGKPTDALVVIDDQTVGSLGLVIARGVALPPGVHHVTVKADGYFPWDHEIDAKLGAGPIRLDVALTPVPD